MKKSFIIIIALLSSIQLTFAQESKVLDLAKFDGVDLRTSATVHLSQSDNQKVELEGSDEELKNIEVEVRGSTLVIRNKENSWFDWRGNDHITIYISVQQINELSVSGSGKIYGKNHFKSDRLSIDVSGSGKIEFDAEANLVETEISGSGKIDLVGQAKDFDISISGSGSVYAEKLNTENCQIKVSGSGKCEINVSKSLDARISGSGSVYYRGNPDKVNSSSSGSGRIRKVS